MTRPKVEWVQACRQSDFLESQLSLFPSITLYLVLKGSGWTGGGVSTKVR